jgi:hypothetical protein
VTVADGKKGGDWFKFPSLIARNMAPIAILLSIAGLTGGGLITAFGGHNGGVSGVHRVLDSIVGRFQDITHASTGTTESAGVSTISPQTALAALNRLPVHGMASGENYRRNMFGEAWSDDNDMRWGHNGCRTREDILARDLTDTRIRGCKVMSGVLHDPYTGSTIVFKRGPQTSAEVQIDHVVALGDAWRTGAQQLSPRARQNLANDPLNLLAVDGSTNESKGSGDASQWLPPNRGFRCAYVTRQIQVKTRYHLWVTPAEKSAMTKVLNRCAATKN